MYERDRSDLVWRFTLLARGLMVMGTSVLLTSFLLMIIFQTDLRGELRKMDEERFPTYYTEVENAGDRIDQDLAVMATRLEATEDRLSEQRARVSVLRSEHADKSVEIANTRKTIAENQPIS